MWDINLVYCIAAAWLIELALGSQRFLPKPSSIVAHFARRSADRVRALAGRVAKRNGGPGARAAIYEICAGAFFTLYFILFAAIITAVAMEFARGFRHSLFYIINALLLSRFIRTRSAADAAAAAREKVRDEDAQTIRQIIKNLSVNCLDGIYAPVIFAAAGVPFGIPAVFAAAHRTLSILARVIRQNDAEYGYFGWVTKKMDDAANFIPSRLCALTLPLLAPACGSGLRAIKRGFWVTRDPHSAKAYGNIHGSLNEAMPAAAIAGILGICLGGDDTAAGMFYGSAAEQARQGSAPREPVTGDINGAIRLTGLSSLIILSACCGVLLFIR